MFIEFILCAFLPHLFALWVLQRFRRKNMQQAMSCRNNWLQPTKTKRQQIHSDGVWDQNMLK